jgi:hemolysin D
MFRQKFEKRARGAERAGAKELAQVWDFLPPVEALQAKHANASLQWTGYVISALLLSTVAWACFSHTDIVVNASGRIVPSARTKVIASVETARVKSINLYDGQRVRAGQVLIELDTGVNDAEHNKATADYLTSAIQKAEGDAILKALRTNQRPLFPSIAEFSHEYGASISENIRSRSESHINSVIDDYRAKSSVLQADIQRYNRLLPIAKKRSEDLKTLALDHDVPVHMWYEQEQSYIETQAQIDLAEKKFQELVSETERHTLDQISEASRAIESLSEVIARTNAQREMMVIRAPVDGVVEKVNIHTPGGVVTAAEKLAEVVPRDGGIEVEAMIENQDIGFVKEGQPVALKVRSFEYSLYGTVSGRIAHISKDAVLDDQKQYRYAAMIKLDSDNIDTGEGIRRLSPGMLVDAEIKTGRRKVIEYILSPLIQHGHEAMKER